MSHPESSDLNSMNETSIPPSSGANQTRRRHPTPNPTTRRWRSLSVNPVVYAGLGLLLFLGTIQVARIAGVWTTTGRVTAAGQVIEVTGADPAEIKGWMTIQQVSEAYGFTVEEFYQHFSVPAETAPSTQLKDIETVAPAFSIPNLRDWLTERRPAGATGATGGAT